MHPEDREHVQQAVLRALEERTPYEIEYRILIGEEGVRWRVSKGQAFYDDAGRALRMIGAGMDITERKRSEEERERLILELREAIAQVKTLKGLLPICASCKKIRDDQGYWSQIEVYVRERSEVEFSHSICPECVRRLYPGTKTAEGLQ